MIKKRKTIYFERAIFINWYCSKRDCAFCYLSSVKNKNPDPKKDRRTKESILAEAIICKACGWPIEFISGGCDCQSDEEILELLEKICKITKQKQWLNLGILSQKQLKLFKPYIKGVCGTVECITPKLRDRLCPSKPLNQIEDMFKLCDKLNLKKSATMVLGLGETIKDIPLLKEFIKKNKVDRITFYRLKPQKNTIFEKARPITPIYYSKWVKEVKKEFPKMKIITGSWLTHLHEISTLIKAGSDGITKFPSIKKFNSKYAKQIEKEVKKGNTKFGSNLTDASKIKKITDNIIKKLKVDKEFDKGLDEKVKLKLDNYLKTIAKNR